MTKYKAEPVIITDDGTMFEVEEIKKYGLDVTGIRFDSKMEGQYYLELLGLQKEGTISDIVCQPRYELQSIPKITYVADFLVTFQTGEQVVVDVKGVETSTFKVKKKLFQAQYPNLELRVLTKKNGQWITTEQAKKEKSERKRSEKQLLKRVESQVNKNGNQARKRQTTTRRGSN